MIEVEDQPPPIRGIAYYENVVEDNELIRAYIAGVFDSRGGIRVRVQKDDSYGIGYKVLPHIGVERKDPELLELLAVWAEDIGVESSIRDKQGRYMWRIHRRDDVKKILELIEPYLLIYDTEAQIILNEIIPRLEDGAQSSREGFIELMEYVDAVRDELDTRGSTKYDRQFFEEEWAEA